MTTQRLADVDRIVSTDEDSDEYDSRSTTEGHIRSSAEVKRDDLEILNAETEAENLLEETAGRTANKSYGDREDASGRVNISKSERRQYRREARRDSRRRRRKKRRGLKGSEESELMYDMEEGGHRDSGDSSTTSSDNDRNNEKLNELQYVQQDRKPRLLPMTGIHILIVLAFIALLYGAIRASKPGSRPESLSVQTTLSNGTSTFAPTTILISLDGFRADFLHRNITPSLNALVNAGVSPRYMMPSFPSVTFPNHFTLVTGLYPESHGVVGNTFWDPELVAEFYYTDPARSMQPKWWQGEPIWETAELQGVRTAVHMWPGSEAHIGTIEPTYIDPYNGKEPLPNKVDRILSLLDLPGPDEPSADLSNPRPQLIAAYVPDVDADGHLYGPNSTEIRATIERADTMVGDVVRGLEDRNLSDIVNVVVVADHGMATTDTSRMIQLDDIIDMSLIEHTDGWPLYGLRPKQESDLQGLYDHLKQEAQNSPGFEVYLRDVDMPERYHFTKSDRIAPLWIVPKTGWAIVTRDEFDIETAKATGQVYHPRGLHGYDHEHPLMRAIFVAKGPAFPHTPGSELAVFQNTEVYNIVCDSVGIAPRPNNGTLRLPLKPVGTHKVAPPGEIPSDPIQESPGSFYDPIDNNGISQAAGNVSAVPTWPANPGNGTDGAEGENSKEIKAAWLAWFKGQVDAVKDWAKHFWGKTYGDLAEGGNSTANASSTSR